MALCDLCAGLDVELLDNNDVPFHESLSSLKRSAEEGCPFCNLCWVRIQTSWTKEVINSSLEGPKLWLRGHIHRRSRWEDISRIWISCERLYEGDESGKSTGLDLFAAPDTPAASYLYGHMSTADRDPDFGVRLAKQWLQQCTTGHNDCQAPSHDELEMPTRVIDVGSQTNDMSDVRLVITDGLRKPYIALSYCWGRGAQAFAQLTPITIDTFGEAIQSDSLSATHRDTFRIARELGIRYVWIDALCIIQGDRDDWEYESKRMGQVYGNAVVTIIAGRSEDSSQGYLVNALTQRAPPCPFPLRRIGSGGKRDNDNDAAASGSFVSLPRSSLVGPVSTRAWCFQEMHLSRRCIVYGEQQMFFRCREGIRYENGTTADNKAVRSNNIVTLFKNNSVALSAEIVLGNWYQLLIDYSMRELSNPYDIFAAVSSVAQIAGPILRSRYLAGVWEADLARGLMWKSRHHVQLGSSSSHYRTSSWPPVRRPEPTFLAPGPIRRAPSWSWAAVSGPTYHIVRESRRFKADQVVVRPRQTNASPERWTARAGGFEADALAIPSCELEIVGRLRQVEPIPLRPVSDYLLPGNWRENTAKTAYSSEKLRRHGILLRPAGGVTGLPIPAPEEGDMTMSEENSLSSVVAIGLHDVAHEVDLYPQPWWCLPLFRTEGLLLVDAGDWKFRRVGWFTVENQEWFTEGEEVEVVLV